MMKKLFCSFLLFGTVNVHAQYIHTIAGTGTAGFSGDSISATTAQLNGPFGVCVSRLGDVFISDRLNNRIRMINSAGDIVTVAGTGVAGYNGDMVDASAAQLNDPIGLAMSVGYLVYVADKSNNRIREVDPVNNGISTIAGTGVAGYSGDSGSPALAKLNQPRDVAVDTFGNIYIADQGNNCIRKINRSLDIITTIAGNGIMGFSGDNGPATAAQLNGPYSVAVDFAGNVYIADVDNERIRMVNTSGIITTIAGTGATTYNGDGMPATSANLSEPICVRVDIQGNVYIADAWHNRIRNINTAGIITTVAGNGTSGYSGDGGPAAMCELNNPYGIALDNSFTVDTFIHGNLLISDNGNNRIRRTYIHTTGIAANLNNQSISISPNPAVGGRFTLLLSSPANEEVSVTITNLLGQQVYSGTAIANQRKDIQLAVSAGIYVVSVAGKGDVVTKRVVVD